MLSRNVASTGVPTSVVSSTIRASGRFRRGERRVTGRSPANAPPLKEGVVKAVRIASLGTATGVLLLASTAALACGVLAGQQLGLPGDGKAKPRIKPAEPMNEDKDKLQGTWRLVTAENDGVRMGEGRPEIKDTFIVFEKSSIALVGKRIHDP